MTNNTQVGIYLDSPKGQVLQVDYQQYKSYWQKIGYQILDEAKELPGFEVACHPELSRQPRLV